MDQSQPCGGGSDESTTSGQSTTKKTKANNRPDQHANDAVTAVAIEEQSADILKLDIDCFEEAFDLLGLVDLTNMGKTCKRLNQVVGYCFQQNHLGRAEWARYFKPELFLPLTCDNRTYFAPFIQRMVIVMDVLQDFVESQSKFRQLKQLKIEGDESPCLDLNQLKTVLSKLEVLQVIDCDLSNKFHEIIDLCPKLRRLQIQYCADNENLFNRKHPTLEYLQLTSSNSESLHGITMFLELNPNIQKFATNAALFWENRKIFREVDIKLDGLAIEFDATDLDNFKPLCNLLKKLYRRGFYRKLQLYIPQIQSQEQINQLAMVNGLVKLSVIVYVEPFSFLALKTLEELHIFFLAEGIKFTDIERMAIDLINLKRIHFSFASIDLIEPFIQRSVNVQKIRVICLRSGDNFDDRTKIINLAALNRKREQLSNAQKITIYVGEEFYLATKWALKETDFGLIRLKRDTSFEWDHDFL